MDDIQAEPGAAFGTPGSKEWIEDVALNFFRNAAAIIRECDLDLLRVEATRLDRYVSAGPVIEAMSNGVEEEVGQQLTIQPGEAVDDDVRGYLDRECSLGFQQARAHTCGNLLGRLFEIEGAPRISAAVDCDLLERLNQAARAVQIGDQQFGGGATVVRELNEKGAPHLARGDLLSKVGAAMRQRRCNREAVADGAADFVRHPGDQAAERRELFGFDEIAPCFAGVQGYFGQPSLVAQFGKQRCQNRCTDRHQQNADLGHQDPVSRLSRTTEIADAKDGRPNN
jgi:hypothetical protein